MKRLDITHDTLLLHVLLKNSSVLSIVGSVLESEE